MPKKKREIPWLDWRGGVAYVFWYNGERRLVERLSLRTDDTETAQRRYAAFLLEGREIFAPSGKDAGLTVWKTLDDYVKEHVKALDDKGRPLVADQRRQEDAVTHLKAHFQFKAVKDITIKDCEDYLNARRAGEIGGKRRGQKIIPGRDGTVRRELVVLIAAIENAAKRKRILRTDIPFIKKPSDSPAKERWLTHEELATLRGTAEGELRDFIDVAYYTASRRDAVERLTVFQIHLEQERITLAVEGERETKKRRPVIRMAPELKPTLARLVAEAKEAGRARLFETVSFYRAFKRLCRGLKMHDVTPHTLRHSRATHLLQQGKTVWDVAGLLGDTVATVERVYGHHSADYQGELDGPAKPDKIEDMMK